MHMKSPNQSTVHALCTRTRETRQGSTAQVGWKKADENVDACAHNCMPLLMKNMPCSSAYYWQYLANLFPKAVEVPIYCWQSRCGCAARNLWETTSRQSVLQLWRVTVEHFEFLREIYIHCLVGMWTAFETVPKCIRDLILERAPFQTLYSILCYDVTLKRRNIGYPCLV